MIRMSEHRLLAVALDGPPVAACTCGAKFDAYGNKGALNKLNDHIAEANAADNRMIEMEMTYTPYLGSCREPAVTSTGDLRQCRRAMRHHGEHASGFGQNLYLWTS